MPDIYDVIIIGGGAAGENVAGRTAPAGLSTAIVEDELVGGECTYWACMPSKALLRPGEALAAARRVPAARGAVTGEADAARALRARDAFASHWNDEPQARWVASVGATLIRGKGKLAGERRVAVETADGGSMELEARKAVVLATGSAAFIPPIEGLTEAAPWTSREATSAKSVSRKPHHHRRRRRRVGDGAGVEIARNGGGDRFGAPDAGGIRRFRAVRPPRRHRIAGGARRRLPAGLRRGVRKPRRRAGVSVVMDNGETLRASELLVAAGRTGVVEGIGLESVGAAAERFVRVNDHLQVEGVDGGWLYAVGDVNGRAPPHASREVSGAAGGRPHTRAGRVRLGGRFRRALRRVHRPAIGQRRPHGARRPRARIERPRRRIRLAGRRGPAAWRELSRRRQVRRGRRPPRPRRRDVRGPPRSANSRTPRPSPSWAR